MSLDYLYFVGLVETFTSIMGWGDGVGGGGYLQHQGWRDDAILDDSRIIFWLGLINQLTDLSSTFSVTDPKIAINFFLCSRHKTASAWFIVFSLSPQEIQ